MIDTIDRVVSYVTHTLLDLNNVMPIKNEELFYRISKENGLSALVFSSLDKEYVHSKLYRKLEKDFYIYVSLDTKQQAIIRRIKETLNNQQIKFILLKGSAIKPLYKETYMRGMGDIDIFIQEEDLSRVHKLFKKIGIKCMQASFQHDHFVTIDDVHIEVHPRLYNDFDPKYKDFFIEPWKYTENVKGFEFRFIKEYELVYLLYHLAKHLNGSGIGLRSVLDIGLYLQRHESKINHEKLEAFLIKSHLKEFYLVIVQLNRYVFDFQYKEELNQKNVLSTKDEQQLLTYIVKSGIHGFGREFNVFTTKNAIYNLRQKNRYQMIKDIVFPQFHTMEASYPYISKSKFLILIAWVSRWIKLLLKKRKSTFSKLIKLSKSKKGIKDTEQVLKTFGI